MKQRLQQHSQALGSDVYITIVTTDAMRGSEAFSALSAEIKAFEVRFTRFQPTSELSMFNQNAGKPKKVSAAFADLLRVSQKFSLKTGGLYNPSILPALQAAGYKGSWPNVATIDKALDYTARTITDVSTIHIKGTTASIPAGAAIDFGGIGKGYLLDSLRNTLESHGIMDYWVSLGGDIVCAGSDLDGQGWQIGIEKAGHPGELAASVRVSQPVMAFATSGVTKRKGEGWHHIIDPRTARPAKTDIRTATVVATSATEADVYAKCLVVLGSDGAQAFMQEQGITQALLQVDAVDGIRLVKVGTLWSD